MSSCYLLHLETPIGPADNKRGQAQHYLGYTKNLKQRMAAHYAGNGARLMEVVHERVIRWSLARTWSNGTHRMERQLKNHKHASRLCPICKGEKEFTAYDPAGQRGEPKK